MNTDNRLYRELTMVEALTKGGFIPATLHYHEDVKTYLEPIAETSQEEVKEQQGDYKDLIEDAINSYFHIAHEQLGRKDLGNIERKRWEGVKNKCEDWFKKHPL